MMTMSLDRKTKTVPSPISMHNIVSRMEQLENWKNSPTANECSLSKGYTRIKFPLGTSFYAACAMGDLREAERLLKNGANINSTNSDGLTSLHQACIDDNEDVMQFLLKNGCDVNAQDVEGWTALHAAASLDYTDVVELLLSRNADPGISNNDNELPIDLCEADETIAVLREALVNKAINADKARDRERKVMLEDARWWSKMGCATDYHDRIDNLTQATPLHVAAAKNYTDVLEVLLSCKGINLEAKDKDGWTALHAASHWGYRDAARLLCEAGSNVDAVSLHGQTPLDVANPDVVPFIRQLKEKYGVRLRRRDPHHREHDIKNSGIGRRSSVIRHSMIEKNLTRMQKEPSPVAMLMERMMLKKTLSGIFPPEKKDFSPNVNNGEHQPSKVVQYRQKMLSLFEAHDGPETPTSVSGHDQSDCCLHAVRSPTFDKSSIRQRVPDDRPLSKQENPPSDTLSPENLSQSELNVDRPQSGQVFVNVSEDKHLSLVEEVTENSYVDSQGDHYNTASSSTEEETTSLDDLDPPSNEERPQIDSTTSPGSSISASISSGGIRILSNVQSSSDTWRDSNIQDETLSCRLSSTAEDLTMSKSLQNHVIDESMCTHQSPKPSVNRLISALESRSTSVSGVGNDNLDAPMSTSSSSVTNLNRNSAVVKRNSPERRVGGKAISAIIPPPISPKPPKDRRKVHSASDNVSSRHSAMMSPTQSSQSETQRIHKARQALANRRSTQGEVYDDSVFMDEPSTDNEQQVDYKALSEQLQSEVRTLQEKIAQISADQMMTMKRISKNEEQAKIKELESENSALKQEKILEELRAENRRLKEENASLIRVISKMSLRNTDVDFSRSNSESNDLLTRSSHSGRSSPPHIITRL